MHRVGDHSLETQRGQWSMKGKYRALHIFSAYGIPWSSTMASEARLASDRLSDDFTFNLTEMGGGILHAEERQPKVHTRAAYTCACPASCHEAWRAGHACSSCGGCVHGSSSLATISRVFATIWAFVSRSETRGGRVCVKKHFVPLFCRSGWRAVWSVIWISAASSMQLSTWVESALKAEAVLRLSQPWATWLFTALVPSS